jgi:hypothetical protein
MLPFGLRPEVVGQIGDRRGLMAQKIGGEVLDRVWSSTAGVRPSTFCSGEGSCPRPRLVEPSQL